MTLWHGFELLGYNNVDRKGACHRRNCDDRFCGYQLMAPLSIQLTEFWSSS